MVPASIARQTLERTRPCSGPTGRDVEERGYSSVPAGPPRHVSPEASDAARSLERESTLITAQHCERCGIHGHGVAQCLTDFDTFSAVPPTADLDPGADGSPASVAPGSPSRDDDAGLSPAPSTP